MSDNDGFNLMDHNRGARKVTVAAEVARYVSSEMKMSDTTAARATRLVALAALADRAAFDGDLLVLQSALFSTAACAQAWAEQMMAEAAR